MEGLCQEYYSGGHFFYLLLREFGEFLRDCRPEKFAINICVSRVVKCDTHMHGLMPLFTV
jgi:hypothetical protein